MQQRPNTIEGTKRSGRTAVAAPVEVITQQGERSGGNRNNWVIVIGCDEGRESRARLSTSPGGKCQHQLQRGERRTFRIGERFRVLFELVAGGCANSRYGRESGDARRQAGSSRGRFGRSRGEKRLGMRDDSRGESKKDRIKLDQSSAFCSRRSRFLLKVGMIEQGCVETRLSHKQDTPAKIDHQTCTGCGRKSSHGYLLFLGLARAKTFFRGL